MKKILLLTCLFMATFYHAAATIQTGEMIVINGDTLELRFYPLQDYLTSNKMKSQDIPGLDGDWSTACYRGYIGIWLVEDNKLYLTDIGSCDYGYSHSKCKMADMRKMFGDKYKDGKVLADWCTDTIYVQYGAIIHRTYGTGRLREREKKMIVSHGVIIGETDYSTLTGEPHADFIRIWDGERIDECGVNSSLGRTVCWKFEWTRKTRKRCDITILFCLNNDCSNAVLTKAEYDRRRNKESLVKYKNDYKEATTDKEREGALKTIDYYEEEIRKLDAEIKKEYRKYGAYIDEVKRILIPLKVETVLLEGKPYFRIYEHTYYFDPKKQEIGVARKY